MYCAFYTWDSLEKKRGEHSQKVQNGVLVHIYLMEFYAKQSENKINMPGFVKVGTISTMAPRLNMQQIYIYITPQFHNPHKHIWF